MPHQPEALQSAQSRVGSTPTSRVRWLLEFANEDLSQITEQDLILLQQQILVFLNQPEDVRRDRLPGKHRMLEWQGQVARGLKNLSQRRSWETRITGNLIAERKDARIADSSTHIPTGQDHWPFTFQAINALIQGADSLRFCANTKCSKLYLRNKRQEYCSTRCRNAANKRLYRQRIQQSGT